MENQKTDILIVGAGPAGITAAIYALRAGLKVRIFDGGLAGGTLNSLKRIENYPGFASIEGATLASEMTRQLDSFGGKIEPHYISAIIPNSPLMAIFGTDIVEADYVVLATGLKRNKPQFALPFEGKGVSYCAVCDGNFYKDKPVAVIGDGHAAFEDAAYLAGIAKKVFLITTNTSLAAPEGVEKHIGKVLSLGGDSKVESMTYSDGQSHSLSVEGVFIATGATGANEIVKLDTQNGFIITDDKGLTSNDKIYAVGDVVKGSLKQIVSACSAGAIAASDIIKRIKNA